MSKIQIMTPNDILTWRGALSEELKEARKQGNSLKVESLLKEIDVMDLMLHNSLYATVESVKDELKIDTGLFNLTPLKQLIGPSTQDATPKVLLINNKQTQQRIAFDTSNTTDAKILEEIENSTISDIKEELTKLLSRNFTSNLLQAINLYKSRVNSKLSPHEAWFEIKKLIPKETMYDGWHEHLMSTVYHQGPLHAMFKLRKHLELKPFQLADFVESICVNSALSDFDREDTKRKFNNHLASNISEYINDTNIVRLAQTTLNTNDMREVKKFIADCAISINPEKRENIRKKYVEKGYV